MLGQSRQLDPYQQGSPFSYPVWCLEVVPAHSWSSGSWLNSSTAICFLVFFPSPLDRNSPSFILLCVAE